MNLEFESRKALIDRKLNHLILDAFPPENPLRDAIHYAISAPGKRIRGVLTLYFCEKLGVEQEKAAPFALALEMIHAYSLVHDDMPEMDNDDYRRGLLTCHKKFGSSTALLAGDAILNYSMEFLLEHQKIYEPNRFINALGVLYHAAGANGMLLGQKLDKDGENHPLSHEELLALHRHKTGALLLAPIQIAEALSGQKQEHYFRYCEHIGLAFQIKDDLLDLEGSSEILGKETGKDIEENKSTFITVLGVEQTREALQVELNNAKQSALNDSFLLWLADYIADRKK